MEVTFTALKGDLLDGRLGQIYMETLLFVCGHVCCQLHVYLGKHIHTHTSSSLNFDLGAVHVGYQVLFLVQNLDAFIDLSLDCGHVPVPSTVAGMR